MTLSEHIKQKRKKNGLSQVELAERAGVGLRFVSDLEVFRFAQGNFYASTKKERFSLFCSRLFVTLHPERINNDDYGRSKGVSAPAPKGKLLARPLVASLIEEFSHARQKKFILSALA